LIIFIFIGLIWGVLNFDIQLSDGGDNGRYIMLGRSILEGKFMREVNTPAEDLHKQYPPLFPLVLSFIMFILVKRIFYDESVFISFCIYFQYFISLSSLSSFILVESTSCKISCLSPISLFISTLEFSGKQQYSYKATTYSLAPLFKNSS